MKNTILLVFTVIAVMLTSDGCKKKGELFDKCKNVTCQHGGTCNDGTCQCTQGWTGSDCSVQVTPSKVIVTKITVTSFVDGGEDLSSYPDIYVNLTSPSGTLYDGSSYWIQDANPSGPYSWTMSPSIQLSPSSYYNIDLWDYDVWPNADDSMGTIGFSPYSSTGGFPTTMNLSSGKFSVQLSLSYTW